MPINASDLMAAQRAYRDARLKLIQAANQQNADRAVTASRDQQALLDYLRTRVKLLTDTRARAMQQFDSEIAGFQQRIGQLQQIINEGAKAAPAPPAPAPPAPPALAPPAPPALAPPAPPAPAPPAPPAPAPPAPPALAPPAPPAPAPPAPPAPARSLRRRRNKAQAPHKKA